MANNISSLERYRRQVIIPEVGKAGQQKLLDAKVLVVGAGGLGSPVLYYLAAAGIGTLGIVDSDSVDITNLQRQILHRTDDLGREKVVSAKEKLNSLNPDVKIITYNLRLDRYNAKEIIGEYDIIVTAVDNFQTRYILNDACIELNKPLVEGGIRGFDGTLITIIPGKGPCYRCIFPHNVDLEKGELGVMGAAPGIIGSLQALEVIKLVLGIGKPLSGRMLFFDGLEGNFSEIEISRNEECPVCGKKDKGE
ncbi:MAG: sulfur-carrier protein adenylyltransferase/sulfurtransferase [Clostridia bacterium]|jgi:adenylyltransferase/sulfurtransferase|nr:hypothetical protein [Clostridiales bacterium]MDK2985616.1 sulfur-carrier protein adenylyltransferase/sulfurtransferase [Clostridia bacterium]